METGTYHYLTQPNEEIISSPQPVSAVQLVLKNGNKITLDNPPSSRETLNNNATLHAKKQEINYATTGKETAEIDEIYHTNKKEWQKALEEEKLPWNQYLATPELSKNTRDDYDLTSIPTFLVIDPEGKIIFSGHNTIFINQDLRRIQKTLLYKILTRNVKPDKIISNNKLIIDYYF